MHTVQVQISGRLHAWEAPIHSTSVHLRVIGTAVFFFLGTNLARRGSPTGSLSVALAVALSTTLSTDMVTNTTALSKYIH